MLFKAKILTLIIRYLAIREYDIRVLKKIEKKSYFFVKCHFALYTTIYIIYIYILLTSYLILLYYIYYRIVKLLIYS